MSLFYICKPQLAVDSPLYVNGVITTMKFAHKALEKGRANELADVLSGPTSSACRRSIGKKSELEESKRPPL